MGHTLSDNRHGLVVSAMVTNADGHAEREAAKVMLIAVAPVASWKARPRCAMASTSLK